MRFSSELLGALARAIPNIAPNQGDSDLTIPNIVQSTMILRKPAQMVSNFLQTSNSFFIGFFAQSRTAAAAATAGPAFTRGLWELTLTVTFLANWDNSASNAPTALLRFNDGSTAPGVFSTIAAFHSGLGTFVHQNVVIPLTILIPADGWFLETFLQTTAAGQITILDVGVYANKLT